MKWYRQNGQNGRLSNYSIDFLKAHQYLYILTHYLCIISKYEKNITIFQYQIFKSKFFDIYTEIY